MSINKKIKSLLRRKKILNFIEDEFDFEKDYPFNELYLWLEKETCDECIEYVISMMEPFEEIVKPLIKEMSSDEKNTLLFPLNDLQRI